MRSEHLAIDGAVVSFEGSANLSHTATAAGWAIVPSLLRAHPFTTYPAGHTTTVEKSVRSQFPNIKISKTQEFSVKNGMLRVALVEMPAATGGIRKLAVGGWEGQNGCLSTSLVAEEIERLVEVFDTLRFTDTPRGIAINSPVTARPRTPQVIKEVPGLGIVTVRPALPAELEKVPRARGFQLQNSELFRFGSKDNSFLVVTRSTVSSITPVPGSPSASEATEVLHAVRDLRIEWRPPRRSAQQ
jgi:hypothetical protein